MLKLSEVLASFDLSKEDIEYLSIRIISKLNELGDGLSPDAVLDLYSLVEMQNVQWMEAFRQLMRQRGKSLDKYSRFDYTNFVPECFNPLSDYGSEDYRRDGFSKVWGLQLDFMDDVRRKLVSIHKHYFYLGSFIDERVDYFQGVQLQVDVAVDLSHFKPKSTRLIILDLDNTLVASCYRPMDQRNPLFIHNNLIYIHERSYARILVFLLSLLGDVIVFTTAKRDYAKRICKELYIPIQALYSRKDCGRNGDEYTKTIPRDIINSYSELIILDDTPSVWKSSGRKIKMIKVGEYRV